jgi:predicted component of type VI protein secretion system
MHDTDIDLRSVHWEHGMLLTPEHFLRQERYIDSTLLWMLRYGTQTYGLVGAGARVEPAERGAARYDPVVDVLDDGEVVKVSVSQCWGLSWAGDIIEIDPSQAVHQSFPKRDLEGQRELGIYVVCTPHDKIVDDTLEDPANPQMQAARRRRFRVQLGVSAAEAPHSLLLGHVQKPERSLWYEKASGFIPLCTTLASHSELTRAWERLKEQLVQLTDRYTTLHKAILEYISSASQRDINTRQDDETLQFVGRMVVTLESCAHEILDPLQPPQRFFQQLHRAIRSAAVYLDLSPPTREYFRQLAHIGETEFETLVEQERHTLLTSRELTIHDNLSVDVQRAENALQQLRRLEEALEGKYVDFRVSPVLEALNFFFDRRSDLFYQSIVRPARPQLFHDELTFVFAPLRPEGQQKYRLILVSMPEARFAEGDSLRAEIRFNVGAGQPLGPVYGTAHCEIPGQRNFAIDVDAPAEVSTISDLRVTMNATWPIKSCLLYVRRFLYPGSTRISLEEPRPEPAPPPQSAPAAGARRRLVR